MKTCIECNKKYKTSSNNQKVCLDCRSLVCMVCKKNYMPQQYIKKGRKTCSMKCRNIYFAQFPNKGVFLKGHIYLPPDIPYKKLNPKWGVIINCAFCGIEKRIKKYQFKKAKKHYCSFRCSGKGRDQGKQTFWEKFKASKEYKLWRYQVFERDNYTCQSCEKRGNQLHPDHILPKSIFPEFMLDINNGRTLCVPCHKKTSTYGNSHMKREDFERMVI